jgi:hypothetical protein
MEHELSMDNGSFERLAVAIETAEDRDEFVKQLKASRQMVIGIIKQKN